MMDNRIKKTLVPFFMMMIFNLGTYMITGTNFSEGVAPHVGLLPISGILFGPYGAIGAVIGNAICDFIRGYSIESTISSEIISLGIALMAYKIWYQKFKYIHVSSKPKLNNTTQIMLFLGIILLTSTVFSLLIKQSDYILYPETHSINMLIGVRYFVNFLNSAFIFGIIGIKLSKYIDFVHIPKTSDKKINEELYVVLLILIVIFTIAALVIDKQIMTNVSFIIIEIAILVILIWTYALKPVNIKISKTPFNSIPEKIMNIFFLATLIIICLGIIISFDDILISRIDDFLPLNYSEIAISIMMLTDILLIIFFVPSIAVLRYVENKVVNPLINFSKIEKFIKKGDKIKTEGLINTYSNYLDDDTEIGNLARSYTNLINFTNDYIENIHTIESEKKRIETELEIAEKIQQAILPTESIENNDYCISGFSRPAKEVGGDFYDYYPIDDENSAIIIGDASGKGVPAALLSIISQSIIRQLIKIEKDPSKVLFSLNNQLCENNPEFMFITLWIGIYNKNTNIITYSNAGHDRPLINDNGDIKFLEMNAGIVLGIMEDFEFEKEELEITKGLLLYTDGITDEKNINEEFYGEKRLQEFLMNNPFDKNIISSILDDISNHIGGYEQFDDMTLVILEKKD